MKNIVTLKISLLFLCGLLSLPLLASIDVYEFDSDQKRADFVSLTKELRCPKCQNQDIADSNAPIAADMRKEVHRLLGEGKDKETIVSYMIDRFGEFVTYKPKKTTETFMLWYGPWILILIGIGVIFSIIRINKKNKQEEKSSAEELNRILDKYSK